MTSRTIDSSLHRLVTANIWYFKPRVDAEAGPLVVPSEIIGRPASEINHSGLLQNFFYQTHDVNDVDAELVLKLRSLMHDFRSSAESMGPAERLDMIMKYASGGQNVAVIIPSVKTSAGDTVPFVPDPKIMSAEELLKAQVPFPKLRSFLHFWQANLEAPVHSVELNQSPVTTPNKYSAQRIFTLH